MRQLLQIGEVAKLIGVSPKTIRYYHEIGPLAEPKRTESGYRLYTAQDLLRLQRIRRLRSLGLPLERIKEILGEPDREHEQVLRNALQSLVGELTAQILELEERREMLEKLLAKDALDQSQPPGEAPPTLLYLDLVKDQLGAYLTNISEESWKWTERIDAMLGAFHWPESYLQVLMQEELPFTPRRLQLLGMSLLLIAAMFLLVWKLPGLLSITGLALVDGTVLMLGWRLSYVHLRRLVT